MLSGWDWHRSEIAWAVVGFGGLAVFGALKPVVAAGWTKRVRWTCWMRPAVSAVWCFLVVCALWGLAPGAWSGAFGQETGVERTPAAAAREWANDEMERLRMEIRVLTELRDAQKALREWNRLRVEAGEPETVLDIELCGQLRAWCAALPGTFGSGAAPGGGR